MIKINEEDVSSQDFHQFYLCFNAEATEADAFSYMVNGAPEHGYGFSVEHVTTGQYDVSLSNMLPSLLPAHAVIVLCSCNVGSYLESGKYNVGGYKVNGKAKIRLIVANEVGELVDAPLSLMVAW